MRWSRRWTPCRVVRDNPRALGLGCALCYVILVYMAVTDHNPRVVTTMLSELDARFQPSVRCYQPPDSLRQVDLSRPARREHLHIVLHGGHFRPRPCDVTQQQMAVIVPFSRDRLLQLHRLLLRLHTMLTRQRVHYRVYVTEQVAGGGGAFNKGLLMNMAVQQALRQASYDCFIFHDVDLLPESDKNIYYCDRHLRHLSPAIDEMRYHPMYSNLAGGVVAINVHNLFKVNGYSNMYWGWGAEDDDFNVRTRAIGLKMTRPPNHIGRYKMIRHVKQSKGGLSHAYDMLITWRSRWITDGLNSVENIGASVVNVTSLPLYTHVLVNVGKAPERPVIDHNAPRESYLWFLRYYFE